MTFTNKIKCTVLFTALLSVGCDSGYRTALVAPPRPLAAAVLPLPRGSSTGALGSHCGEQTIPAPGAIADVVVAYLSTGRNFHTRDNADPDQQASAATSAPDGYVIRVVPLNCKLMATFVPAQLNIALYADGVSATDGARQRPLLAWEVQPSISANYWAKTRLLDGYVLRLDADRNGPGPGRYRLIVRLTYADGETVRTLCRAVTFEDNF